MCTDYDALPPQRRKVMLFIRSEVESGRPFPSRKAIAQHMGWKRENSSVDVLVTLSWQGFIDMHRDSSGKRLFSLSWSA